MPSTAIEGLSRGRLRLLLGGFFLALGIPAAVLIVNAYGQLKWEAFHQSQSLAQNLAERIDQRLQQLVTEEDRRSFTDFEFLVVRGDQAANFVQPSTLSTFPVRSDLPGLIGHFQVDSKGQFSSPLLPMESQQANRYGINEREREQRAALENSILDVLSRSALAKERDIAPVANSDVGQSTADEMRTQPAAIVSSVAETSSMGARSYALKKDKMSGASTLASPVDSFNKNFRSSQEQKQKQEQDSEKVGAASNIIKLEKVAGRKNNEPELEEKPQKTVDLDSLKAPRLQDLKLDSSYVSSDRAQIAQAQRIKKSKPVVARKSRREFVQSADQGIQANDDLAASPKSAPPVRRIATFESELDPMELSRLDARHLVLYRTAWRDEQRYTQGALIDLDKFMRGIVGNEFAAATLANYADLTVAWQDEVAALFNGQRLSQSKLMSRSAASIAPASPQGSLLYRMRLSSPAAQMELLFSVREMPVGPGAKVLSISAAVMALVLAGGVLLMYRLSMRELALAAQQRDFVAAVSHELRTPLTSIRMYAEMLREGWASEEKKRGYYDFIHSESERLSRLIANVLQLARMTRNDTSLELTSQRSDALLDGVRSKIAAVVDNSGFELNLNLSPGASSQTVDVNEDAFYQIIINLVDNAIKFSSNADTRRIDINCALSVDRQSMIFSIRDYGAGIAADQRRKIFDLFYRSENELTRETVGTGIGLALVNRLAQAMHGSIDVTNADPGAVFSLSLPLS